MILLKQIRRQDSNQITTLNQDSGYEVIESPGTLHKQLQNTFGEAYSKNLSSLF